MNKTVMTIAVAAVSMGAVASGFAAGTAEAQPGHQRSWVTDDGWKASIASTQEKVQKVAPPVLGADVAGSVHVDACGVHADAAGRAGRCSDLR